MQGLNSPFARRVLRQEALSVKSPKQSDRFAVTRDAQAARIKLMDPRDSKVSVFQDSVFRQSFDATLDRKTKERLTTREKRALKEITGNAVVQQQQKFASPGKPTVRDPSTPLRNPMGSATKPASSARRPSAAKPQLSDASPRVPREPVPFGLLNATFGGTPGFGAPLDFSACDMSASTSFGF